MANTEAKARIKINDLLRESGWRFFDKGEKRANIMHKKTDLSPFMAAQQLIENNHWLDIDIADIYRLWGKFQSVVKHSIRSSGTVKDMPLAICFTPKRKDV